MLPEKKFRVNCFAWSDRNYIISKLLSSKTILWIFYLTSSIGFNLFGVNSLQAQVTSDNTLGTEVNTADNIAEITGGTEAGSSLFHSFQDFSLETGNTAFFNNASDISNIIGRVTGGNLSNIDGLIRANGEANLILINPSGINFGANASLDIGGSFLGSTADSIIFGDGTVLSARDTEAAPMLTVSVPVGLQLGQNPAAITVTGQGHNLSLEEPIFSPFTIGEVSGLEVRSGQTLALVGGNIDLAGGTLSVPGGRIELGSAAASIVNLDPIPQGWRLSYEEANILQDISLSQQALVNASGTNAGFVQIQGREVNLQDGSTILIQNQGDRESGSLVVNASEALNVRGTTANGELASSIFTEALSGGEGGEIQISTPQLAIEDGGAIISSTFGAAEAGGVNIDIAESLRVAGFSAINPSRFSIISSQTFSSGNAGSVNIATQNLTILEGGNISSVTGGAASNGSGGQVNITAGDTIELIGVVPEVLTPSLISAGTGSAGNAGNVTINTRSLVIRNGGRVDAATTATGNGGNVAINATDALEISGTVPNSLNPSLIVSGANILDSSLQELFRLPPVPSGNAGNIRIETSRLDLTDGASITSSNDGTGNSGSIDIIADFISLDNGSNISSVVGTMPNIFSGAENSFTEQPNFNNNNATSSASGANLQGGKIDLTTQTLSVDNGANVTTNTFTNVTGGNIIVNASESIQVRGFFPTNPTMLSFVSTSSFGAGDSGNLTISTGDLDIFDGSRVAAGSFSSGSGGNVNVEATSIEVKGAEPSQSAGSLLGASTLGVANAGNLTVNTNRLMVRDGGRVDSSTAATGSAGDVDIKASELIEVSGTIGENGDPSLISSGANVESEIAQRLFGLPPRPSGNAGNVTIETVELKVTDRANVSVVNEGSGNAGTLQIDADLISLDNRGSLTAATQTGVGGNITLQANNVFLQSNSITTATAAAGAENGGNISINSENLALVGNSRIIADAFMGMGGNIQINSQGFFVCQECQISASSQLGFDGRIQINTLQPDSQMEVFDLPRQPTQAQENVKIACETAGQVNASNLVISGRGGLPPRPQDLLSGESLIDPNNTVSQVKSTDSATKQTKLPAPARGWYTNSQGMVILSAQALGTAQQGLSNASCHID